MVIAQTTLGAVKGREKDAALLFAGIPYAAPPIDNLRFRAALPHEPWSDARPALKFGPAAPQIATGGMTDAAPVRSSEDCLTLNISTPAVDAGKRPVLFWIHGGGYRTGQAAIPWYNGTRFALNGDIVVVSINYRLGALGFTDLSRFGKEYETSGINGILDQITALRWVRDNIENFGGDPAQVTIAGESAGGFSVCTLLGSPLAKGLFRAAISQSGGAHHTLPAAASNQVTDRFLAALEANGNAGTDALTLDALSTQDILAAQQSVSAELEKDTVAAYGVAVAPFYPAEGTYVLPESPLQAIAGGLNSNVPVLTGTNRDETTLWGYGKVDDAKLTAMAQRLGAAPMLSSYRACRPEADASELMIALTTDHMFRIPTIRLAEAREQHGAKTWMYFFCWASRAFGGRLGATHALEIPFAFNNLDKAGVDVFLGEGPSPQSVADAMHAAWIEFIRSGDPGWQRYDSEDRATMCFDEPSTLQNDPYGAEREAWQGLR